VDTLRSEFTNGLEGARILVTGATGFIGSNLTRRLAVEGSAVAVVVRPNSRTWRLGNVISRTTVLTADLSDAAGVQQVFRDFRPDVVYHVAAAGVDPQVQDAQAMLHSNVLGSWNVALAAQKVGVVRIIFTGTAGVYEDSDSPLRETSSLNPRTMYAASKVTAWFLTEALLRESGISNVNLRLFTTYGPGDWPGRLIPHVILKATRNEDIELTSGWQSRDFVYIGDVVEAFIRAGSGNGGSGVINIGSGHASTVRDVVGTIMELTGSKSKAMFGALPHRKDEIRHVCADVTRVREVLGWEPETSLADGLGKTIEWIRANPERAAAG
jgi:nucleoside-diphosphate-sugar epimerase